MSDVPLQVYVFPVVMVGITGYMVLRARKMRARFLTDNPQYGLGVLAQRWHLQMVEGDPAYNLFVNNRDVEVGTNTPIIAGMTGHTPAHTARMVGEHRGHPVQFELYDQTAIEKGVIQTTYTRTYRAVLSVGVNANVPPFEVVLRNENQYLVVERQLHAPEQRTGNFAVDQALTLLSHDPNVGVALAPVMGPLTAMTYVHVVAGNGSVRFEMSPLGTSYGVYYAETVMQVLLAMADVLEGRQPVMPAPPPPPMAPR